MTTLFWLVILALAVVLCVAFRPRRFTPVGITFTTLAGEPAEISKQLTFRYKPKGSDKWVLIAHRKLLALVDEENRENIEAALTHVRFGFYKTSRFTTPKQNRENLRKLNQFARNISPTPTGKTYTTTRGQVYQQMSNGQYALRKGDRLHFITYLMLLGLLDEEAQIRATDDHLAYIKAHGEPSEEPRENMSVYGGSLRLDGSDPSNDRSHNDSSSSGGYGSGRSRDDDDSSSGTSSSGGSSGGGRDDD